eukprot:4038758-Prymnesium_polylepis.2
MRRYFNPGPGLDQSRWDQSILEWVNPGMRTSKDSLKSLHDSADAATARSVKLWSHYRCRSTRGALNLTSINGTWSPTLKPWRCVSSGASPSGRRDFVRPEPVPGAHAG